MKLMVLISVDIDKEDQDLYIGTKVPNTAS